LSIKLECKLKLLVEYTGGSIKKWMGGGLFQFSSDFRTRRKDRPATV